MKTHEAYVRGLRLPVAGLAYVAPTADAAETETHQPGDRASGARPADLLHGFALRHGRHLRAGRERRSNVCRLHQLRHGTRSLRCQGTGGLHARPGRGGKTASGHRTPAVIVNVPVTGIDEASVRANVWMFAQVLATGVHGVLLCHADSPAAVRAFVEAIRFPIHKQGLDQGIKEGRRGVHGVPTASRSGASRRTNISTKPTLGR